MVHTIVKADFIPSQAYRLYIKLYCERKCEKNKKIFEEAKKSWASLSLQEKKIFYKTSADRKLLKYAHNLSNIETFLKEKKPKKQENDCNEQNSLNLQSPATSESINKTNTIENRLQPPEESESNNYKNQINTDFIIEEQRSDETVPNQEAGDDSPMCETTNLNKINDTTSEDMLEIQSNFNSNQDSAVIPLSEPTPPTVKVGKDLYELIKGPGDIDWKDMKKKEKNHYNSAVRAVKRDYIKHYTIYLESLSQKQLFDHYMKTLH